MELLEELQMRILLAENDMELSQALNDALQKERLGLDLVYNGTEGLEYAKTGIYDAVLLDTDLPEIDGISILTQLREEKNSVPILMISARGSLEDKLRGLDAGADDYMVKPVEVREVCARLRALTRRKGGFKEKIQTFGDLTLNENTYELMSADSVRRVKLSLKEFQIVELLFQNPRQIITKELIIEKIWGGDSDAEYNNVEVYISFIRKKIEYLNVKTEIRTARGIGYSLEDRHTSAALSEVTKPQA